MRCCASVNRSRRWARKTRRAPRSMRSDENTPAPRKERARHILTGHTLDDQAETVLFRLARGSGLSGLAGIARISPLEHVTLIRPLLDIPKARLLATLKAAKISFIEDPSNRDPRFARTRLRQLVPALAGEGLDAARLAVLA